MISVCIPVYNRDVRGLVKALYQQLTQLGQASEILLIDDASDEGIRKINREIPADRGSMVELPGNIGRARIRNRFLDHAKGTRMLFLDCDISIPSDEFLRTYLEAENRYPGSVICGGSLYADARPALNRRLHWRYGRKRESRPALNRNLDPSVSFMSANFLIPRELLAEVRFEETLSGYGHEDSLFGYRLMQAGHSIVHIDNPVIHEGLETNAVFLDKTDEGLQNLNRVSRLEGTGEAYEKGIKLLRFAAGMDRLGISPLIRLLYFLLGTTIRMFLRSGIAPMPLFSFYKLGRHLTIRSRQKK
jgi:glycosyltransferase involved in cell wall biosynthesis